MSEPSALITRGTWERLYAKVVKRTEVAVLAHHRQQRLKLFHWFEIRHLGSVPGLEWCPNVAYRPRRY